MFISKVKFFFAAAALFIVGVSAGNAQLVDGSVIKVSVTEAFVLRDKTFAAGNYTIERTANTADSPSVLVIRGNGQSLVFDTIIANTDMVAGNTQLVFENIGGMNYLSSIRVKGDTVKNDIARTRMQNKLAQSGLAVTEVITIGNLAF